MRRPLITLCAWVMLATRPADAAPPRLAGVQVVRSGAAVGAVWTPPARQALVCLYRTSGPDEPIRCLVGAGPRLTFAVGPQDEALQLIVGDEAELRASDDRGRPLAVGRATVADRWRTFLPVAGR